MYMNGVVIGMETIHHHRKLTPLILPTALVVCIAVVIGAAMLPTAECLIATSAFLITRAIASVFA